MLVFDKMNEANNAICREIDANNLSGHSKNSEMIFWYVGICDGNYGTALTIDYI